MTTIYHNPKCSTSRTVLGMLQEAGLDPRVVEYLKTPPSRAELQDIAQRSGVGVRGLLRKKDALYTELELESADDAALLDAMRAHPVLIERPIVVTGKGARVCRPVDLVREII